MKGINVLINKYSLSSFHFFSLSLKYWGTERGGEGVDGRMCGHADVPINSNAIHYLGPSIEKMWPVKIYFLLILFYRLKGV